MTAKEAFEAWARPRWTHPEDFDQRIGARPGVYNNYEVQAAHDAWNAAERFYRAHHAAIARRLNAPAVAGAIEGGES